MSSVSVPSFNCFICGLEIFYIHEKENTSVSWHEMPKVTEPKRKWSVFFLSELHCLKKKSKDDCSVNVIAALFIRSIYTVSLHSLVDIIEIC